MSKSQLNPWLRGAGLSALSFSIGLLTIFLSNWRETSSVYMFSFWIFFALLLRLKPCGSCFLVILGFFSGTFFGAFEGMVSFLQSELEIGMFFSLGLHLLFSYFSQLAISALLMLPVVLASRLRLGRLSFVFVFALMLLVGRLCLPNLFPLVLSAGLGGGDSVWIQLFSLFGVEGLEFVFMLVNGVFAIGFLEAIAGQFSLALGHVLVSSAVLIGLAGLSSLEKNRWSDLDSELRFAYYQPGDVRYKAGQIETNYKQEAKYLDQARDVLSKLAAEENKPDFVVFPETYFFSNVNRREPGTRQLKSLVGEFEFPLISGGHSFVDGMSMTFNSLFYIDATGNLSHIYNKSLLMPVGEVKLFKKTFPILSEYLPGEDVYEAGELGVSSILDFEGLKLGLSICYEDMAEEVYGSFAERDPDIILGVSSDNQFDSQFFALNHMSASVARALSLRRPLIRVTNTGFSVVVDALGQVVDKTGYRSEELRLVTLPFKKEAEKTVYARYKPFQLPILIALVVVLVLCVESFRRKNRH